MTFEERLKLCDAGPDLVELMDHIKMTKREKTRFLKLFQSIDDDNSGFISLIEFFVAIRLDHNPFIERSFRAMDINEEGESNMQLDVCEFFIGLCNICFFPQDMLVRYMFDLYDDDCNGSITVHELSQMVEDVVGKGKEELVDKLMKLLDGDGSLDISFTEFMKVERKAGTIMRPCFRIQETLQEKCMGRRFWRKKKKRILKKLKEHNVHTLVDFFAKMIEKDMPPPPEVEDDDLVEDVDSDEEELVEKSWEQIEAERVAAEQEAKVNEYINMDMFVNEFEEFRKFTEPSTGRNYWVNTKTREELWECPAPGVTIMIGDFVRALDHTYERAYWYNKRTMERFWNLPQTEHANAKKYTKNALALRRARGFPDPPTSVSCAGGAGRAAVWWPRPNEHEKFPNTKVYVLRYRLDFSEDPANPEWEYKGKECLTLEDGDGGSLPVQHSVVDLKELSVYKFSVIMENSIGESVESEFSNQVKIISPLPNGWIEYDLDDGRSFYANAKTKQVRWDRPESDPFYIETELFLKFSRREMKKIKRCYAEMDWDQSLKINVDEFKDILVEIGEHKLVDDEKKFKWLWKTAEKDEFGEIGFRAVVVLLDEWREVKMNHRGICARYICWPCIKMYERRFAPKVGKGAKMLTGDDGKKMGEWVKCNHPLVDRPYYHNSKTKETTWEMPNDIRFHINDKLNNDLRRRYDASQIEEFQKEFQTMDLDGSGAVDEAELGLILENLGEKITASRLKGLIKEIDKDGSGEIEYEEFVVMLDAVWRGKGTFGWSRVTDTTGDKESKKKLDAMKENLDEYTEEYENQQLEEARRKGKKYPHGKYCYCGCRKPLMRGFGQTRVKSGR